ncbi:hypothetical protein [Carnobacterium maltaromaticum]|uniref:hypothetical protein n=1 Tax=Carnobacterium maltaromaticum TaxID=2751 RepID=UPI0039BDEDE9
MEQGLFFPSKNGDRKYKASDFTGYFSHLFSNGVFSNNSENLQVLASKTNGLAVVVGAGYGNINGYLYQLTEAKTIVFKVADVSGTAKKGAVVLRMDLNERLMSVETKGTTELTRTNSIYELMLAEVAIPGGGLPITQSMIKDTRGNGDLCGYVSSLIDIDPTTLWLQFEADYSEWLKKMEIKAEEGLDGFNLFMNNARIQFKEWFDHLKIELSDNVASNLQNQIDGLTIKNNLITIQHNLTSFPHVSVTSWSYGIGLTPLGFEPNGLGGSDVTTLDSKISYDSRNSFTVKVPETNRMVNPAVKELSEHSYLLTEAEKSIQIDFINLT